MVTMAYSTDHKSWLAKLVAFDTVNVNLNVEMLDYIKGYLKTPGIDSTHIYNPESDHVISVPQCPARTAPRKAVLCSSATRVCCR